MFNLNLKKEKENLEKEIHILTSRRDKKRSKRKLEQEIRDLKKEIQDVKHQKKISDEDIAHMVKMKTERLEIEQKKKSMEKDESCALQIKAIKDEYSGKMESRLQTEVDRTKEMYTEILQLVPKINVALDGKVK